MLLIKHELLTMNYSLVAMKRQREVKSSGRITCGFDVCGGNTVVGGEAEGERRIWNNLYFLA